LKNGQQIGRIPLAAQLLLNLAVALATRDFSGVFFDAHFDTGFHLARPCHALFYSRVLRSYFPRLSGSTNC